MKTNNTQPEDSKPTQGAIWSRRSNARDRVNEEKDHFYPTPPNAVRALLRVERFQGAIWEPACGDGAISNVPIENGHEVISTDLVARGFGLPGVDFLMETKSMAPNIITNPPYKLATEFVEHALKLASGKVAMLLRLAFLEGKRRKAMFDSSPLARVWVFSERIRMQKGRQATKSDTGGMIAYAWFVWDKRHHDAVPPVIGWL